jgi:hypothetical protein
MVCDVNDNENPEKPLVIKICKKTMLYVKEVKNTFKILNKMQQGIT